MSFVFHRRLGAFLVLAGLAACGGEQPLLRADVAVTLEDTPVSIAVLANDERATRVGKLFDPAHGVVEIMGQEVLYTPGENFYGKDSFRYEVSGVQAVVTVEVSPVNDPPVAGRDLVYMGEFQPAAGKTDLEFAVLGNDTDPEGQELELLSVSDGRFGMARVLDASAGRVAYTPVGPVGEGGRVDRLTYRLKDESGAESEGDVLVLLGISQGAPVALGDAVAVLQGQSATVDLLENDLLAGEVSVQLLTLPGVASLELDDAGIARIEMPAGFVGSDEFEYALRDGQGLLGPAAKVYVTAYTDLETPGAPTLVLPRLAMSPRELAVVVNQDDPDSSQLADAYMRARGIPPENRLTVSLGQRNNVSRTVFGAEYRRLLDQLPEGIQGFALMFRQPFSVDCMSVTSAFAFGGFNARYCQGFGQCTSTAKSGYFNVASGTTFDQINIRPAMMLAGQSREDVEALLRRGVAADGSFATGTAYFVRTRDVARNVRWPVFESTARNWNEAGALACQYVDAVEGGEEELLRGLDDVLVYQTGLVEVDGLDTLAFRPGAVADHLTSAAGDLSGQGYQMSALAWLEAGATASYGTVVEPCNYTQKFPRSDILLDHYYRGETLLEAYWKSVEWPGEGVFVGEPLARPWGRQALAYGDGVLLLKTTELDPSMRYKLWAADVLEGPYTRVRDIELENWGLIDIEIETEGRSFFRLEAEDL